MANLYLATAIDVRDFSLSAPSFAFADDANGTLTLEAPGFTREFPYEDSVTPGGDTAAVALGSGVTVADGVITGGTVTALVLVDMPASGSGEVGGVLDGLALDAALLNSAMSTPGTADDKALLRGLLSGDDYLFFGISRGTPVEDSVRFFAGDGDDSVVGGDGRDVIFGNTGNDTLDGLAGGDRLRGGAGDDDLEGDHGNDRLFGGKGSDFLYSSFGDDRLYGGPGRDILSGYRGSDTLFGGAGRDRLFGGNHSDTLDGGAGVDILSGGQFSIDIFVFSALNGLGDLITDFEGQDIIQITVNIGGGLVPGTLPDGAFVARQDNNAQDSDDRLIFDTLDTSLWFDPDGKGADTPVLVADLTNDTAVAATNILIV